MIWKPWLLRLATSVAGGASMLSTWPLVRLPSRVVSLPTKLKTIFEM